MSVTPIMYARSASPSVAPVSGTPSALDSSRGVASARLGASLLGLARGDATAVGDDAEERGMLTTDGREDGCEYRQEAPRNCCGASCGIRMVRARSCRGSAAGALNRCGLERVSR